jgi:hypothetical protein
MIKDLSKDIEQKARAQEQLLSNARTVTGGSIDQAYHFFDAEIKKRFGDDQSKADVMVATRLGAMGFSESEVASAIAINSPLVRPSGEVNKYDWNKYGDRAARVAFNQDAHIMRDYAELYSKLWEKQLGWVVAEPKTIENQTYSRPSFG